MHQHHGGQLLVALPALEDPNFERTVVLLLEHDEEGALGVVLNRPSLTPVAEVLDGWGSLAADPAWVYGGGPVEPSAVVALGVVRTGVRPGITVVDRICTVDPTRNPDDLAREVECARVFVGYAGWGPGQLEAELEQGAWLVVPAHDGDVCDPDPEGLWSTVLARQPGRVAWLARYPEDPRLN